MHTAKDVEALASRLKAKGAFYRALADFPEIAWQLR